MMTEKVMIMIILSIIMTKRRKMMIKRVKMVMMWIYWICVMISKMSDVMSSYRLRIYLRVSIICFVACVCIAMQGLVSKCRENVERKVN